MNSVEHVHTTSETCFRILINSMVRCKTNCTKAKTKIPYTISPTRRRRRLLVNILYVMFAVSVYQFEFSSIRVLSPDNGVPSEARHTRKP